MIKAFFLTFILFSGYVGFALPDSLTSQSYLTERSKIFFTENSGQIPQHSELDHEILYYSKNGNVNLYFTQDGVLYNFITPISDQDTSTLNYGFKCIFKDANKNVKITTEEEIPYRQHYYTDELNTGITSVKSFQKILYKDIYPNIDLVFYTSENGIKYDFILHPGGNVKDIQLVYESVSSIAKQQDGSLVISNPLGTLTEAKPFSYQDDRSQVESNYKIRNNIVGFEVGPYDKNQNLVIDPGIEWATYFSGGEYLTESYDIALDKFGNVYMIGSTNDNSLGFNGYQNSPINDGRVLFITKFNTAGQRIWSTYLEILTAFVMAGGIEVDNSGNIIVTGYEDGEGSAFLAKLNQGGAIIWRKRYSDNYAIVTSGIVMDKEDNIYLTGSIKSGGSNLPINGYDDVFANSGNYSGKSDGFILKIGPDARNIWGTYCGGEGTDVISDIAIDSDDNIYVVGDTRSTKGIVYNGFDTTFAGDANDISLKPDGFLAKYNKTGQLVWSTYFGGTGTETRFAVATDNKEGFVYLGGTTIGSDDLAYNAYDSTINHYDIILAKFSLAGERIWSTYYQTVDSLDLIEQCYSMEVGPQGNLFVAGYSSQQFWGEYQAGFVAKISNSGFPIWAEHINGTGSEKATSIKLDRKGNIFLSADVSSSGLGYRGFKTVKTGDITDAFLMKLRDIPPTDNSYISGYVFEDLNNNCEKDPGEIPLQDVVITTDPIRYFGSTDSTGYYIIEVDTGNYTVRQLTRSDHQYLLSQTCPEELVHQVEIVTQNDTISNVNFSNQVKRCHYLEVNVSSNQRRICSRNYTTITYQNDGLADAINVEVYLELPDQLIVVDADREYSKESKNIIKFMIGQVAAGSQGRIELIDSVACINPSLYNRNLCTKVWITPENNCFPPKESWDRSDLLLSGKCLEESVKITLKNVGEGDMEDSSSYEVFLNDQLAMMNNFRLTSNDSMVLLIPATDQLVFVKAFQTKDHPSQRFTSLSHYGCNNISDSTILNFSNIFPQDESEPSFDSECLPVIGSFDPNDKQVMPIGIGPENYTPTNTSLEYTIRFQNTGTAVAYDIKIIDTLDINLALETLQIQGSSHPSSYSISGENRPVITWEFENIFLPDSSQNEPESHGFVKYSVYPKNDLLEKTQIKNSAHIYFDYNEPVQTNTTVNTIYDIPFEVNSEFALVPNQIEYFKPHIHSFDNEKINIGQLKIIGENFHPDVNQNVVRINNDMSEIFSATKTELVVNTKINLKSGLVSVSNAAGTDEQYFGITAVEEDYDDSITIYPNPNNGFFTMQSGSLNLKEHSIELIDAIGRNIPISIEYQADNNCLIHTNYNQATLSIIKVQLKTGETLFKKVIFNR